MAGSWSPLTNQPRFNANHIMLSTDGTVLVQELASAQQGKRFVLKSAAPRKLLEAIDRVHAG